MKKLLPVFVLPLLLILLCGGCANSDRYYGIDHFSIREDGDAFREAMDALTVDVFRWYQSLEGEDGVYLMHYDLFTAETLAEWKAMGLYQTVPDEDVHYYTASVNYLTDRGLSLSPEEQDLVAAGVRLYLLPESLSTAETAALRAFLTEDALLGVDGDSLIETTFMSVGQIEFRTYHFDGTLEVPGGEEISNPVIYVADTANMSFFEAESLVATGVQDGYIRLTEDAYRQYAGDALPAELQEQGLTFRGLSSMSN
ncbi:MAG: hypothetical protein IKD88_06925 [Lachnospiraceae bacterium]|nr:hypothetical protein [Lachnospiraceae bacterium]